MKRTLFLLFLLVSFRSSSQVLPPYTATVYDSSQTTGYYFLCAIQYNTTTSLLPQQLILDHVGRPVYMRRPFGSNGSDFKVLPNGYMSFHSSQRFLWKDSLFHVVDTVHVVNGIVGDAHDIKVLPNGHILLLGTENVLMDLSSYYMFNQNGSPGSAAATVKSGVIQELDAARNVVFEWHAKDWYDFDDVDEEYLGSPTFVDWTHFNAVEMDTDGNILVCSRHFNEITKINRSDSTILWRLGGKRNQFTFTNDTAMFAGQHDISRLANGNILLYDNGRQGPPLHPAAAKEYALDETSFTSTLAWSYVENPATFSRFTGGAQRLPNGNTVIDYGNLVNENIVFNVVNSAGAKVFELAFNDTAGSYRTYNYATLPWALPRPGVTCHPAAGILEADTGYSSYQWSTGDTTRILGIFSPGTYYVQVPAGDGGYIRSEYFYIPDPQNMCLPTGIPGIEPVSFQLYPNPVIDKLNIVHGKQKGSEVVVTDVTGRVWLREKRMATGETTLDVNILPHGVYLVLIGGNARKFIR